MWCRQSLPPTAGLLSGPLVVTQATAQTTIALPKLPSAEECACLSPRNILSPFGQAWKDGKADRAGEKGRKMEEKKREHMSKAGRAGEGKGESEDWRVRHGRERD